MNKLIHIRLFCSQDSFRYQFIARMLTFYGGAPKDEQGNTLSEDNVIVKLQSEQLKDKALKFFIDDYVFMIVQKDDVEITQQRDADIKTIFLLLLQLKQEITDSLLEPLKGYQIQKNSFFVFVDKLSDKTSDTQIQLYENEILNGINSNMNVLIDEMNIFTILFQRSQESKQLIFKKLEELAQSIFGMSFIESYEGIQLNSLDNALMKICSQYSIENVQEFTDKVKNGDLLTGCSKVKDRKQRKKLLEELQSFPLLNQFILHKKNSTQSIVGIKFQEKFCQQEGATSIQESSNLLKFSEEALKKVCQKFDVPNERVQRCLKQIFAGDFDSAKLNIKIKGQRQLFIKECKECPEHIEYLKNKQEQQYLLSIKKTVTEDLLVILKEYVIDPESCLLFLFQDKILEVLEEVKKIEQQSFLQKINVCSTYQNYLNLFRKKKKLFERIKQLSVEGKCQSQTQQIKETCQQSSNFYAKTPIQNESQFNSDIKVQEQNIMEKESIFLQIVGELRTPINAQEDRFEVEYKDGKKEGKGTAYYANGDIYEGEWKNDVCDGKGTLFVANKGTYEGEFKNNDFEGKGTLTLLNGSKFRGEWSNGRLNGNGFCQLSDGSKYEGEWRNHRKCGKGTYYYASGDKYIGEWSNDVKEGQGIMFFKNGNRYEGDYKNGYMEGKGTFFYHDGAKYVGEYKNGNWEGNGTFYWENGIKFEGEWRNNKQNGDGIETLKNGRKIKGKWKDGKRISECIIF